MIKYSVEQYISANEIQQQVKILSKSITERFQDSDDIVMVGLLKGSCIFLADLCRQVHLPLHIDFMCVSSYHAGTKSSGDTKILKELDEDIKGKHVIIVEDIIDTGKTLEKVVQILTLRDPHSISICTLLDKPSRREADIKVDWVGFEIPNDFVVGYGMDHNQKYRNLPYLGRLVIESS